MRLHMPVLSPILPKTHSPLAINKAYVAPTCININSRERGINHTNDTLRRDDINVYPR
jgi:hypothetical protein